MLQKRDKEAITIPYIKMQELVSFYSNNFGKVNQSKTKETILKQIDSIKKTSGHIHSVDFELAMIKLLEVHLNTQISIEMEIYEAADVAISNEDQWRRHA